MLYNYRQEEFNKWSDKYFENFPFDTNVRRVSEGNVAKFLNGFNSTFELCKTLWNSYGNTAVDWATRTRELMVEYFRREVKGPGMKCRGVVEIDESGFWKKRKFLKM